MSDLIDRQALLKQIDIDSDGEPGYYGDTWKFIDTIKSMPNVHDLPKDADMISRQAAIEVIDSFNVFESRCDQIKLEQMIGELPPAQPEPLQPWEVLAAQAVLSQPKLGKWIYHIDDLFPAESTMECNQCHAEQPLTCDDEFCPHCGAKMEVTT